MALSVTEVAIKAGLADGAQILRQFHGAFGLPPSLHRSTTGIVSPKMPINPADAAERRQYV